MSLFAATLATGIFLLLIGFPLLLGGAGVRAAVKALPRSSAAAWIFFGGGAVWFLCNIWNLSSADFGDYHVVLFLIFGAIAVFAFKCVPDFLAVRGACLLMLLCASPLLNAAYMEYAHPQRLFMVALIYLGIVLAICLGAQPWRMRDFIGWLQARPARGRGFGCLVAAYGALLCILAFTY